MHRFPQSLALPTGPTFLADATHAVNAAADTTGNADADAGEDRPDVLLIHIDDNAQVDESRGFESLPTQPEAFHALIVTQSPGPGDDRYGQSGGLAQGPVRGAGWPYGSSTHTRD